MTPRQLYKYRAIWAQIRDKLRARGLSSKQCEDYRHAITRRALGADKSSTAFINAEFDAVLQVFAAELKPTDLDGQLALQEMPEKRVSLLIARIDGLSRHIGLTVGNESRYVDGIAMRMFGRQYHELPERGLQQIEGILRRRLRQMHLTAERVDAIEREVAEQAARHLATVTPSIEHQHAAAAAAITREDDELF